MADSHKINFEPVNIEMEVGEDENILDAAFRQGIHLMHGCREGRCSACKSYVLDGEIQMENYSTFACNDSEVDEGYVLLCRSHAFSDCTIELLNFDEDELLGGVPIQDVRTRVIAVEPMTRDIVSLRLQPDRSRPPSSSNPASTPTCTSPAPRNTGRSRWRPRQTTPDEVEFLIKKYPGGKFSALLDGQISGRRRARAHRALRVLHAQGRTRAAGGLHRWRRRDGADPVAAAPHERERKHPPGPLLLRGTHRSRPVLPRRHPATRKGFDRLRVRRLPVRIVPTGRYPTRSQSRKAWSPTSSPATKRPSARPRCTCAGRRRWSMPRSSSSTPTRCPRTRSSTTASPARSSTRPRFHLPDQPNRKESHVSPREAQGTQFPEDRVHRLRGRSAGLPELQEPQLLLLQAGQAARRRCTRTSPSTCNPTRTAT